MIVDAWMQHPTAALLRHEMFDSLRRWTGSLEDVEPPPIEATLEQMDRGGVAFGILSAWHGPQGVLVGNDAVAGWVRAHPDRFAGLAAVDLGRPMEAVRELRRA